MRHTIFSAIPKQNVLRNFIRATIVVLLVQGTSSFAIDYKVRWSQFLGLTNLWGIGFGLSSLTTTVDGAVVVTGPYSNAGTFLGVQASAGAFPSLAAKISQDGRLLWLRTIGTDLDAGRTTIWGSAADAEGNIYVAGDTTDFAALTRSTPTEGPIRGGFVIKYTSDGDIAWDRYWIDWPLNAVAVDMNGIYLAGEFSFDGQLNNGLLVRLEKDGTLAWNRNYPELGGMSPLVCGASGTIFVIAQTLTRSFSVSEFAPDGSRISIDSAPDGNMSTLEAAADRAGELLVNHYRATPEMQALAESNPVGSAVNMAVGTNGVFFLATQIFPQSGATLTRYSPVSDSIGYSFTEGQIVLHWDPELGGILETCSTLQPQDWTPAGGTAAVNGALVFTNSTDASVLQFFRVRK